MHNIKIQPAGKYTDSLEIVKFKKERNLRRFLLRQKDHIQ